LIFRLNPNKKLEILFIKRALSLKDKHSGQIAFPGGKLEPSENSLQAAIRETTEEIGLVLNSSEYLGYLPRKPAYQGGLRISNLYLSSHIFFLSRSIKFSLNPPEVHSYRWVEFSLFTHYLQKHIKPKRNSMKNQLFKTFLNPSGVISGEFPGLLLKKSKFCDSDDFEDFHLWGATLRIMRNLMIFLPAEDVKITSKDWVYYNLDWPNKILNPFLRYIDSELPESLTYKSFIIYPAF
jgi:8-oxo-dGTP pyrophosphatase MutT (NUDIX family)